MHHPFDLLDQVEHGHGRPTAVPVASCALLATLSSCAPAPSTDPLGALQSTGQARVGESTLRLVHDQLVITDLVETSDYLIAAFVFVVVGIGVAIAWVGEARVIAVAMAVLAAAGLSWTVSHERSVVLDPVQRSLVIKEDVLWGLLQEHEHTPFDDIEGVARVSRSERKDDDRVKRFVGVAVQRRGGGLTLLFEAPVLRFEETEQRKMNALRDHVAKLCALPIIEPP